MVRPETGGESKVETGEIDPRSETMTEKAIAIAGVATTDQRNGKATAIETDTVAREVMSESEILSVIETTGMNAVTGVTTATMQNIRATGTTGGRSSTIRTIDMIDMIATSDTTDATGITGRARTTTPDRHTETMNMRSRGHDLRALKVRRSSEKEQSVEVEVPGAKETMTMTVADPRQMILFITSIAEVAVSTVTAGMAHPHLTTLMITIDDRAWNIIATTGGDPAQRWDTRQENTMMAPTIVILRHHAHRTLRHIFSHLLNQPLMLLTRRHNQVTRLDTLPHSLDLLSLLLLLHHHRHQFIHWLTQQGILFLFQVTQRILYLTHRPSPQPIILTHPIRPTQFMRFSHLI